MTFGVYRDHKQYSSRMKFTNVVKVGKFEVMFNKRNI